MQSLYFLDIFTWEWALQMYFGVIIVDLSYSSNLDGMEPMFPFAAIQEFYISSDHEYQISIGFKKHFFSYRLKGGHYGNKDTTSLLLSPAILFWVYLLYVYTSIFIFSLLIGQFTYCNNIILDLTFFFIGEIYLLTYL